MNAEHKARGKIRNFAVKPAKSILLARRRGHCLPPGFEPVLETRLAARYFSELQHFIPDALLRSGMPVASLPGENLVRIDTFQLTAEDMEKASAASWRPSSKAVNPENCPVVFVKWAKAQEAEISKYTEVAVKEWAKYLPLFIRSVAEGKAEALSRAATAYKPQVSLSPVDLERLEMQKNAAEAILGGTEWLIAADIARLTKRSKSNPNALANRWKNEGKVFAIRYEGVERYPRYAFNDRLEPLPVIAEVLQFFGKDTDPWKIAAWFESANAWLDSKRPREVLDEPQRVIAAVRHRKGWAHG